MACAVTCDGAHRDQRPASPGWRPQAGDAGMGGASAPHDTRGGCDGSRARANAKCQRSPGVHIASPADPARGRSQDTVSRALRPRARDVQKPRSRFL